MTLGNLLQISGKLSYDSLIVDLFRLVLDLDLVLLDKAHHGSLEIYANTIFFAFNDEIGLRFNVSENKYLYLT